MIHASPGPAARFLDNVLAQGRHVLTKEQALEGLRRSPRATYMALHRLVKAGRLVMPRSGFYVLVEPQYRAAGSPPPSWFIDDLMKDMGRPYYVGLLSAAALHGAAHQQPMVFQVVIPRRAIRSIECGRVRIGFYGKGPFDLSETADVKTVTGSMRVSTPETTAWDLVRYTRNVVSLDHVSTVLSELAEKLDARRLRATVKRHGDVLVAQRLGYVLDLVGRRDLSKGFAGWVRNAPVRALVPHRPIRGASENRKWRLLINERLEPEV